MNVLAVDFGTSNTVIAYRNADGQIETLDLSPYSRIYNSQCDVPLIPSLVYIANDGSPLIGQLANQKGDRSRVLFGFKRELCQEFTPAPLIVNGTSYSAIDAAKLFWEQIIAELKKRNITPQKVVATVPVGSFESYSRVLRDILAPLGCSLSIIDESTAAALHHGVHYPGTTVLVIDIGGGTLDLSLVQIAKPNSRSAVNAAKVVAKTDRAYGCGGIDIDHWIVDYVLQRQGIDPDAISIGTKRQLLNLAEKVKIALSFEDFATESFFDDADFTTYDISLNREQFEEILDEKGYIENLRDAIDEILEIAHNKGFTKNSIKHVVLVGGSSLIPAVQNLVVSMFGAKKVAYNKPFEAVAHGALRFPELEIFEDHLRHTYAFMAFNPYTGRRVYRPIFAAGTSYPTVSSPQILKVPHNATEIKLVVGELNAKGATEVYYDESHRLRQLVCEENSSFHPIGQPLCLTPHKTLLPNEDFVSVVFSVDDCRILRVHVYDIQQNSVIHDNHPIALIA